MMIHGHLTSGVQNMDVKQHTNRGRQGYTDDRVRIEDVRTLPGTGIEKTRCPTDGQLTGVNMAAERIQD